MLLPAKVKYATITVTLHVFTQRSKLEIDSHCENLVFCCTSPFNIYQFVCDRSKPKVVSSPTPLAIIIKE